MIDEQNQLETNPEYLEKDLNSSAAEKEDARDRSLNGEPEANNSETSGEAATEAMPNSETATALPDSAQIIATLQKEIESLNEQLEQQNQQTDAMKKRYLSLAADFDNFRKRTQKEKEELEVQIKCKTISELLPVIDNFERARTQIKPANDGEMNIHQSYQGVYKELVKSLKQLGVSAMRPESQPFDPNYHEAMLQEQTDEHPEGTVLEQLVRGYTIGDRVLRHAMVKVAAPKESSLPSEEETPASETSENPAS